VRFFARIHELARLGAAAPHLANALSHAPGLGPIALRWILDQQGEGFALWGARKPEQVDDVVAAAEIHLTESDLKEIETVVEFAS